MVKNRILKSFLLLLIFISVSFGEMQNFYVSPQQAGKANGSSLENPATYLDMDFWETVNKGLEETEITVWFTEGEYNKGGLHLTDIGNDNNRLTIKGATPEGIVMNSATGAMLRFSGCKNILVENLNFTGLIKGYCLVIGKNKKGTPSNNIVVKRCSFIDLPELFYGCFGAHYGSYDITLQDSIFKRTGSDIFCHHVYNAYGVKNVNLINNHFEDSSGSYVRYRDDSDYAIISGNTFVSTGNSIKYGEREIFLDIAAYSLREGMNETFGTNFKIIENKFLFCEKESDTRYGVRIHHTGFNPEGKRHLLSYEEAEVLKGENLDAKKKLLLNNCAIDTSKFEFKNNLWKNQDWKVGFVSWEGKAEHDGWTGEVDISELFVFEPTLFEDNFEKGLDNWWAEGTDKVYISEGKLHIDANDDSERSGMFSTVWFKQKLEGNVKIEFDAFVVDSKYDVNNINFFLHYAEEGKDIYSTRTMRLDGEYSKYHDLNGYILTYVRDSSAPEDKRDMGRFRIRKCPGFELISENFAGDVEKSVLRKVEISIVDSVITMKVNGEKMCVAYDENPYSYGYFAIRTYMTHLWIDNVRVYRID